MGAGFQLIESRLPILGMRRDLPQHQLPDGAWWDLRNVRVTPDGLEKVGGYAALQDTGSTPVQIALNGPVTAIGRANYASGSELQVAATDKYIYRKIGEGRWLNVNSTAFAESLNSYWDVVPYYDLLYLNRSDGAVTLRELNAAVTLREISTAPLGKTLGQIGGHLLLGGLVNIGGDARLRDVVGSAIEDGTYWDITNTNSDVRQFSLPSSYVQRLAEFGDYAAILADRSISLLSFVGGTLVYQLSTPVTGMGLTAPRAVLGYRSLLYFQGLDNFYEFNGTPANRSFGDPVWKYYTGMVYPGAQTQTWMFYDEARDEFLIPFQSVNSDAFGAYRRYTHALVFSIPTKAWSIRDFPFSAMGYLDVSSTIYGGWDELPHASWSQWTGNWVQSASGLTLVAGDQDGKLWRLYEDGQEQANGSDIEAVMETGEMDFGSPRMKYLSDVYVTTSYETGSAQRIMVGVRDYLTEPVRWLGPYTADSRNKFFVSAQGRYFTYRFSKPDGTCKWTGYASRIQETGVH